MGVEYRHYVMPKVRGFAPDRAQLDELVEALRAARWVDGEPEEQTARGDLQVVFSVERWGESRLRYPFSLSRPPDPDAYYEIELHVAAQYVHHSSEIIDPLDATSCSCGASVEFEPEEDLFFASRLHLACPKCGRQFDPSALATTVGELFAGERCQQRLRKTAAGVRHGDRTNVTRAEQVRSPVAATTKSSVRSLQGR